MKMVLKGAVVGLMACAFLLLIVGLAFWTGNGFQLVWLHVTLGVVLVGLLWLLVAVAVAAGAAPGLAAAAAGWGLLVLVFGMGQRELVPGPWHWTVQLVHLVISMGAVWWGRRLAKEVGRVMAARAHRAAAASIELNPGTEV